MRLYCDVNLARGSRLMCKDVNDVHTVANLGDMGWGRGREVAESSPKKYMHNN